MLRIGVIYPSDGAYDAEFQQFAPGGVSLHFTRWAWPDRSWFAPDHLARLEALGTDRSVEDCARLFQRIEPAAVTMACTSASFAAGRDADAAVLRTLARGTSAPVSTTSTGFAAACRALRVQNVAVASIYRPELTQRFVAFLAGAGTGTVAHASRGWQALPSQAEALTEAEVYRFVTDADHPGADAVLVPETDLGVAAVIGDLERDLGKPVLSAAQVTVWHAARIAGATWTGGTGRLFDVG